MKYSLWEYIVNWQFTSKGTEVEIETKTETEAETEKKI